MSKIKNVVSALLLGFFLTGCATLPTPEAEPVKQVKQPQWNETTCQQTDWYQLGLEQGEQRHMDVDIAKVATTCVKQGVTINSGEYLRGLEQHAQTYCTLEQGYQLGLKGEEYPNLCRKEIYSEFYFEWYRGAGEFCRQRVANMLPHTAYCEQIKS
jgi:hypothetical protein